MRRRTGSIALAACLGALASLVAGRPATGQGFPLVVFEQYLDALRQQARIPGLSAAIVQGHRIVWERGLGFQDLENSVRATPDTLYPVDGLTQTFASVLVLRCMEAGRVTLDAPLRQWVPDAPAADATIRQLLGHTTIDATGEIFRHDNGRFALLTPVIEQCTGRPFQRAIAQLVLDRLAMIDSVPGLDLGQPESPTRAFFDAPVVERYTAALARLARAYRVDKNGRATRTVLPATLGASAASGLVTTVRDLARYDAGLVDTELDNPFLLERDTLLLAWTNVTNAAGVRYPTGLGWFVQGDAIDPIVWQYGLIPGAYSSLYLRLPAPNLTLILAANSDGLSAPFQLASGDVTASLFARLFLRVFGAPQVAEP